MNPIDIALRIATTAHAGQTDRDGYPVILHPLAVGLMGHTDEEKIAGFLHDVVEDTSYTFNDLLEEGIPAGIVNALRLLTHDHGSDYFEYVQRIIDSGNPIALQVKYNDLQHNFARGKAHPDLQAKHGRALAMVKAAIKRCSQVSLYHAPADENIEVGIFACGCCSSRFTTRHRPTALVLTSARSIAVAYSIATRGKGLLPNGLCRYYATRATR